MFVAACVGSTSDGFTSVATGDTYGEWELFAEVRDGGWTGCLRIEHDSVEKRCAAPKGFVEFSTGVIRFGAAPAGTTVEFVEDGRRVPLYSDLDLAHDFFVVADEADVRPRG